MKDVNYKLKPESKVCALYPEIKKMNLEVTTEIEKGAVRYSTVPCSIFCGSLD